MSAELIRPRLSPIAWLGDKGLAISKRGSASTLSFNIPMSKCQNRRNTTESLLLKLENMTGVEAIPLGILLHGALNAFKSTSKLIRTLKHHARDLQRIQVKLATQRAIFSSSCIFLLGDLEGDQSVDSLVERYANDKELDDKLNQVLSGNKTLCVTLATSMKDILEDIETELKELGAQVSRIARYILYGGRPIFSSNQIP